METITPPANATLPDAVEPVRPAPSPAPIACVAAVVALGVLAWAYWPTLLALAERWAIDPQYSHGFLVPVFAVFLLWMAKPEKIAWRPDLFGIPVMLLAGIPRWFTGRMDLGALDGVSLLGSILGAVLLVGGREVLRWAWPSVLFLGFMIPLPYSIEQSVAIPLRGFATEAATYVLQTFGYPALAEGNVIHIDRIRLGVIDACSGLGMLMTFLALATAMAMTLRGPLSDRLALVVSAPLIAVFANVLRITLTGMAYRTLGLEAHGQTVHDALGWLMMPLALFLLWVEYRFLQKLFVAQEEAPLDVPLSPWVERAPKPAGRWG